jgi:hypothetical protein
MPNRARSLHGAAVAYAAAGKPEIAKERQAMLQSFWQGRPLDSPTASGR